RPAFFTQRPGRRRTFPGFPKSEGAVDDERALPRPSPAGGIDSAVKAMYRCRQEKQDAQARIHTKSVLRKDRACAKATGKRAEELNGFVR
ncbi:MAG: hypothetical protein IKS68_00005, partial [Mailhella sp.]|nr:hypothetical protein [Mailhella sp.]